MASAAALCTLAETVMSLVLAALWLHRVAFPYCDRMFGKWKPRKGRFVLEHSLGGYSPWCWGSHGNRSMRQWVTWHPFVLRKQRGDSWSSHHSILFIQPGTLAHGTVLAHLGSLSLPCMVSMCVPLGECFFFSCWCLELTHPCFSLSLTSLHSVFKCAASTRLPRTSQPRLIRLSCCWRRSK